MCRLWPMIEPDLSYGVTAPAIAAGDVFSTANGTAAPGTSPAPPEVVNRSDDEPTPMPSSAPGRHPAMRRVPIARSAAQSAAALAPRVVWTPVLVKTGHSSG